jgi:hypothetical protein
MARIIDEFAKALASGASRRSAVGGIFAGATALLPWTAEAAKRNKRKKQRKRRKAIKRYLEYCQFWCEQRFGPETSAIQSCINMAESGKGPCYAEGPGHFCLRVKKCGKGKYCCPELMSGDPVSEGSCCPKGSFCAFLNGTVLNGFCVT